MQAAPWRFLPLDVCDLPATVEAGRQRIPLCPQVGYNRGVRDFLLDTWQFIFRRHDHPIYRRELTGWSTLGIVRGVRRGCLPLMLFVIVGVVGCCGLTAAPIALTNKPELWPVVGVYLLGGLFTATELIRWLVGILATVATSTAISAEIEAQSYALLRLTPIPTRQVVLAKYGAALQQLRLPLIVVAVLRALCIVGSVAFLVALIAAGSSSSVAQTNPAIVAPTPPSLPLLSSAPGIVSYLISGVVGLLALLAWFLYYLLNPALTTMIYGAIGLMASSWSRTRASGVLTALAVRVGLWAVNYVLSQVAWTSLSLALSLITLPVALLTSPPTWLEGLLSFDLGLLVLLVAVLAMLVLALLIAFQIGLTMAALALTVRRAERLPFG